MKNIVLYVTRDSVCAADDIDAPHVKKIALSKDVSVEEIVQTIFKLKYLPRNIEGGKATWSVASKIPLAVIAQQWVDPKMVSLIPFRLEQLDILNNEINVHINYHAQIEPELVLDVLRKLKLNAGKK